MTHQLPTTKFMEEVKPHLRIMSLLFLNHLLTCLALMASGQWLRPHVPLSLSPNTHTTEHNVLFGVLYFH
jgi:hypothetical protein